MAGPGPTQASAPAGADGDAWSARPGLAWAVNVVAFLAPILVAVGAASLCGALLPAPHHTLSTLVWWALIIVVPGVVYAGAGRLARRALPLAALLRATLVFPDRAPSRLRVARRAGSTKALERQLREARERGAVDEPMVAAEHVLALAHSLNRHDRLTRGHSERVRMYTDLIADQLRLAPEDRNRLRWAALLHDIGKLSVSVTILNKRGAPTAEEWRILETHPQEGARLAAPLMDWLGPWADTIAQHHERYDGNGYPAGLAGEEISLGGRIVAVADSFETITAVRSYKPAMSPEAGRQELARCAGTQFDPVVVRAFLQASLPRMSLLGGPLAWLGALRAVNGFSRFGQLVTAVSRTAVTMTAVVSAGATTAAALHPVAAPTASAPTQPAVASHPVGASPSSTAPSRTGGGHASTAPATSSTTRPVVRGAPTTAKPGPARVIAPSTSATSTTTVGPGGPPTSGSPVMGTPGTTTGTAPPTTDVSSTSSPSVTAVLPPTSEVAPSAPTTASTATTTTPLPPSTTTTSSSTTSTSTTTTPSGPAALQIVDGGGEVGRPQAGDEIIITFPQDLSAHSICTNWTTTSYPELRDVTIYAQAGTGGADDMVTGASSAACGVFHFGSIDLGQSGYFSGDNPTFTNGTATWNGTNTLTLVLGRPSSDQPTHSAPSVATYQPDPNLVEPSISSADTAHF
jgi:hypothetical protein